MSPHRTALPQTQGPATSAPAPAGPNAVAVPSDAAATQPALNPKYHGTLRRRVAMYQAVLNGMQPFLEDRALDLPPHCRHELMHLQTATRKIEALMPYLLEGKSPPNRGTSSQARALTDYLKWQRQASVSVRELVIDQPQLLLPLLDDMNSVSCVVAEVAAMLAEYQLKYMAAAPEFSECAKQLRRALSDDMTLSMSESKVQQDILINLGSSVMGSTQNRMDHHRHSTGAWLAKYASKPIKQAGARVGMNMTDSQTYGLKIHSELTENFGEYFDIQTSGDKQVELSLKPEVLGRTSTPQLLGRLEDMTQFLGLALYRKAVKAAINASQDVQWVQRDGLDRLALTPAALERMAISEAPDASLAGPPRDRVLTLLEQAADGLMLSALKAAVATPLREKISALTERTGLLRNPLAGSSHDKAEFLNTLVDDLVASPDARGMLVRVDHACEAYKALRLGSSHARDGGNTAVLLADIRIAVQRYLQDPE